MKTPLLAPKESSPWRKWLVVAIILSLCVLGVIVHEQQQEEALGEAEMAVSEPGSVAVAPVPAVSVAPDLAASVAAVPDLAASVAAAPELAASVAAAPVMAVPVSSSVAVAVSSAVAVGEEPVDCLIIEQHGYLIGKNAELTGCTTAECSSPTLTDITCDPKFTTGGAPAVKAPCTKTKPFVEFHGCTGNHCLAPALGTTLPEGYDFVDPAVPPTLTGCTTTGCSSGKQKLSGIKCAHGFTLGEYQKILAIPCSSSQETLRFLHCNRIERSYRNPVALSPPGPCYYQDFSPHARMNEYITPCMCGDVSKGGTPVQCDFENSLCVVDQTTGNGMCTHLCARDSDCGKMVCDFTVYATKETTDFKDIKLGRCVNKDSKQPVDYRTENPPITLHKEVTAETTKAYEAAFNLNPESDAPAIPVNTILLFIFCMKGNNFGHAAIMYNAGKGVKHISRFNGHNYRYPRKDVSMEHKMPDVIYRLENIVWNQDKLEAAEAKIKRTPFQLLDENCSWAVKKILHCTNFPIQRWRGVFSWTPWILMKTVNAVFKIKGDKKVKEQFNVQRYMRPDMADSYWTNYIDTLTDPQHGKGFKLFWKMLFSGNIFSWRTGRTTPNEDHDDFLQY